MKMVSDEPSQNPIRRDPKGKNAPQRPRDEVKLDVNWLVYRCNLFIRSEFPAKVMATEYRTVSAYFRLNTLFTVRIPAHSCGILTFGRTGISASSGIFG